MNKLNSRGFSIVLLLAIIVFVLIGGAGYYVWARNDKLELQSSSSANTLEQAQREVKENVKEDASNSSANTTTTTQPDQEKTIALPQSSFSAEQFHDQIQIGMLYSQVVSLAGGQTGSCEMSNAPAPNDYMNCTWQDSSVSVGVSFQNQKVTYKTKRSL